MKGYKAFNNDMTCKGFKFEEGKEYEIIGNLEICNNGFHFCENPFDILDYYELCESKFAEIEALGKTITEGNKTVTSKIKIVKILNLADFNMACHIFISNKIKINTEYSSQLSSSGNYSKLSSSGNYSKLSSSGNYSKLSSSGYSSKLSSSGYYSKLSSSGYYSQLSSSGYYSQLSSSGDSSKLSSSGDYSVIANIGVNGIAKGKIGNWITLAEYDNKYKIKFVKSLKIDGKRIKENVWYKLKNKKFIEVNNE